MLVLIVEDDDEKSRQLVRFFGGEMAAARVEVARSLQSGLRFIERTRPDLLVLDMTLPNYDQDPDSFGGLIHPLGGLEFLRELDRDDIFLPAIVVTQYETFGDEALRLDDLNVLLREEYGVHYLGLVQYQSGVSGWQNDLQEAIQRLNQQPGR